MRLLLDTHIAIWALTDHPRLGNEARTLLSDPGNEVFVSAVNVLEVGIKHAIQKSGPNAMEISARQFMQLVELANFEMLPVQAEHAAAVGELESIHRDPFDRLLVAQALAEDLRLVTHDRVVASYGPVTLKV